VSFDEIAFDEVEFDEASDPHFFLIYSELVIRFCQTLHLIKEFNN
jgi:hypothetical protein